MIGKNSFTVVIRYLRINLTSNVQNLYEGRILGPPKRNEDMNKWKDLPCSWIG